jgi:high affinity choline transporter 7
MAVNISGLISVIVFYILILAIGIWAARKTKKANNEDLMLASAIYMLSVFILRVQIQGYIARLFSIEINRKIFITI